MTKRLIAPQIDFVDGLFDGLYASDQERRFLAGSKATAEALVDWLEYAEENLHEFDVDGDECAAGEKLCPRCENSGCIQMKIRNARAALLAQGYSYSEQE
jgi:hypothetical protein